MATSKKETIEEILENAVNILEIREIPLDTLALRLNMLSSELRSELEHLEGK